MRAKRLGGWLILVSVSFSLGACGTGEMLVPSTTPPFPVSSQTATYSFPPTILTTPPTASDLDGTRTLPRLVTVAGHAGVNPPADAPAKTVFTSGELIGWVVNWHGFVTYVDYAMDVATTSSYCNTPIPGTTFRIGITKPIAYLSGTIPITVPPGHYQICGYFGPYYINPGGFGGSNIIHGDRSVDFFVGP